MKPLSPEAHRLVQLYQNGLLVILAFAWVGIGIPSLWALRVEIGRLLQYFTWAGLKYSFFYQPGLPSLGLLFCLGFTLYVLLSQSRYELFGLIKSEREMLEKQVEWLRLQGSRHPLHRWIFPTQRLPPGS